MSEKIRKKAIPLEKYGMNDFAWEKVDALELIKSLMNDKIGILGGDLYKITENHLTPLYDNWSCDPFENETEEKYFFRSKILSQQYIENYPVQFGERIIFSITFTEQIS